MTPRELDRRLRAAGWQVVLKRGKGGHRLYNHPELPGVIVIPWHNRDLAPGTLSGILKRAGLK